LNGFNVEFVALDNESGMLPPETLAHYRRIKLDFHVPSLPPEMRFDLVSVAEQPEGTNSRSQAQDFHWLGTTGNSFMYMIPASTKTFLVKVAVYRQLTDEFVVKPMRLVATNAASSSRQ
jgi:hypothetical protein